MMRVIRHVALVALLLCAAFACADSIAEAPHVKLRLISESTAIVPGQTTWMGLQFELDPGWHVYWVNPGDSGEPPKVKWALPQGISAGDIQWPTPERIKVASLVDYGYSGSVMFLVPLKAESKLNYDSASVAASVSWLVCKETCIPGKAEVDLEIPVDSAANLRESVAPLFQTARRRLPQPIPGTWQLSASESKDNFVIHLKSGEPGTKFSFLPQNPQQIENASPQDLKSSADDAELQMKKSDQLSKPVQTLAGLVVTGSGESYAVQIPMGGTIGSTAATAASTSPVKPAGSKNSVPSMLFFGFLGGMILNLMPCVFPVLSLKALGLVNAGTGERGKVRTEGLLYGLGVLVSCWALVGSILLLRVLGSQIGWGFQLQSPAFVVILAVVLFLLGLSMLGVFEIGMSMMGMGSSLASKGGMAGAFFTGVLATVVATPCTAPFMGTAVGFALAQPAIVAFSVFTALGLGLALPYVLLAWFPQWARVLPRPGAWMETFKQVLAFPLFAAVVWLVWVFGRQAGMDAVAVLLGSLTLVGLAGWMFGRSHGRGWGSWAAVAVLILSVAVPIRAIKSMPRPTEGASEAGSKWQAFTPEKATQISASGKPVFVDFSAAWCLTCQVNERVVLGAPEVQKGFSDKGVVLMKADWTNSDPVITQTLASYGRSGVPFYLLYDGKNAKPTPLPEVLTKQVMLDALAQLK